MNTAYPFNTSLAVIVVKWYQTSLRAMYANHINRANESHAISPVSHIGILFKVDYKKGRHFANSILRLVFFMSKFLWSGLKSNDRSSQGSSWQKASTVSDTAFGTLRS